MEVYSIHICNTLPIFFVDTSPASLPSCNVRDWLLWARVLSFCRSVVLWWMAKLTDVSCVCAGVQSVRWVCTSRFYLAVLCFVPVLNPPDVGLQRCYRNLRTSSRAWSSLFSSVAWTVHRTLGAPRELKLVYGKRCIPCRTSTSRMKFWILWKQ